MKSNLFACLKASKEFQNLGPFIRNSIYSALPYNTYLSAKLCKKNSPTTVGIQCLVGGAYYTGIEMIPKKVRLLKLLWVISRTCM